MIQVSRKNLGTARRQLENRFNQMDLSKADALALIENYITVYTLDVFIASYSHRMLDRYEGEERV